MPDVTELMVNGARRSLAADPEESLLNVLRDTLGITGPKYGCGEGQCGACTVLINGFPRRSCITKVGSVGAK
ncbi:MAG: 2Fe-2S iron-sulfur cluster-binding protein, partial [Candidatus Acidiferrales bacterium]